MVVFLPSLYVFSAGDIPIIGNSDIQMYAAWSQKKGGSWCAKALAKMTGVLKNHTKELTQTLSYKNF